MIIYFEADYDESNIISTNMWKMRCSYSTAKSNLFDKPTNTKIVEQDYLFKRKTLNLLHCIAYGFIIAG